MVGALVADWRVGEDDLNTHAGRETPCWGLPLAELRFLPIAFRVGGPCALQMPLPLEPIAAGHLLGLVGASALGCSPCARPEPRRERARGQTPSQQGRSQPPPRWAKPRPRRARRMAPRTPPRAASTANAGASPTPRARADDGGRRGPRRRYRPGPRRDGRVGDRAAHGGGYRRLPAAARPAMIASACAYAIGGAAAPPKALQVRRAGLGPSHRVRARARCWPAGTPCGHRSHRWCRRSARRRRGRARPAFSWHR